MVSEKYFKLGQVLLFSMYPDADPDNPDVWIPMFYAGRVRIGDFGIDVPLGFGACKSRSDALKGKASLGFNYAMTIEEFERPQDPIEHLDLVYGINPWNQNSRLIGFYDSKNNAIIKGNEIPENYYRMRYESIPRNQWPDWAIEAHKSLEV